MLEDILASTFRLGIPLILVSYAGLLSERSGVANIGLEAQLMASAFFAAATTTMLQSPVAGVFGGMAGALIVSGIFAYFCIHGRGDDIVVGTALNILVAGSIPVFNKSLFGITGSTPSLEMDLRFTSSWTFGIIAILSCLLVQQIILKSVWGLRVNAAGENPSALNTQGVSAVKIRYQAVIVGSLFSAFAGAYLSICQGSGYVRNMSAGRGYMALAALILGGWKPIPTAGACLAFAFFDAIQMRLQGTEYITSSGEIWTVPNQFIQILPFIVTLFGLAFLGGRMKAPRAINKKLGTP
jgi:general nucleoside transport system permease protein